jgi:hypothetical protein
MKRIKKIIGVILMAPVVIVLAPFILAFILVVVLPGMIIWNINAAISLRIFRRREAGHVFLICTSRRGWHDFLKNNVIPVLPDNVRVVWKKPAGKSEYRSFFRHLDCSHIFNVSKPYLVLVTPRALIPKSLNETLQKLKTHPEKSEETRRACAEIIAGTENDLRTMS